MGRPSHPSATSGTDDPRRPPPSLRPLLATVGRERELALARQLLAPLPSRRLRTLAVRGPAGIGKTHLAAELAASARHEGFRVLHVAARADGRTWVSCADDASGPTTAPMARTLASVVASARVGPLLVVLDDLEHAPPDVHDLLWELAVPTDDLDVAVLALHRPWAACGDDTSEVDLDRLLDVHHLELGPVDDEAIRLLLAEVPATEEVRARAAGLAGGSPGLALALAMSGARLDPPSPHVVRLARSAWLGLPAPVRPAVLAAAHAPRQSSGTQLLGLDGPARRALLGSGLLARGDGMQLHDAARASLLLVEASA